MEYRTKRMEKHRFLSMPEARFIIPDNKKQGMKLC